MLNTKVAKVEVKEDGIHAHSTLHESVGMAAEIYEESITDLPNAKAKKNK